MAGQARSGFVVGIISKRGMNLKFTPTTAGGGMIRPIIRKILYLVHPINPDWFLSKSFLSVKYREIPILDFLDSLCRQFLGPWVLGLFYKTNPNMPFSIESLSPRRRGSNLENPKTNPNCHPRKQRNCILNIVKCRFEGIIGGVKAVSAGIL